MLTASCAASLAASRNSCRTLTLAMLRALSVHTNPATETKARAPLCVGLMYTQGSDRQQGSYPHVHIASRYKSLSSQQMRCVIEHGFFVSLLTFIDHCTREAFALHNAWGGNAARCRHPAAVATASKRQGDFTTLASSPHTSCPRALQPLLLT